MTASTEFVLKALQNEFTSIFPQLQQNVLVAVYATVLGLMSASAVPAVYPCTFGRAAHYD